MYLLKMNGEVRIDLIKHNSQQADHGTVAAALWSIRNAQFHIK